MVTTIEILSVPLSIITYYHSNSLFNSLFNPSSLMIQLYCLQMVFQMLNGAKYHPLSLMEALSYCQMRSQLHKETQTQDLFPIAEVPVAEELVVEEKEMLGEALTGNSIKYNIEKQYCDNIHQPLTFQNIVMFSVELYKISQSPLF